MANSGGKNLKLAAKPEGKNFASIKSACWYQRNRVSWLPHQAHFFSNQSRASGFQQREGNVRWRRRRTVQN
jgi:hypothetical protein